MEKTTVQTGLGFVQVLQIAFIVLKLCKIIYWPWVLVLLPVIISFGILVIVMIIWLILVIKRLLK
jgi:hypothetical protein